MRTMNPPGRASDALTSDTATSGADGLPAS